jgi:hypothetical protein
MEVRVQLVHADAQVRVVHVSAYAGEQLLGSALGEASDAEAAEDRALQRLMARLAAAPPPEAAIGPAVAATPVQVSPASAAAVPAPIAAKNQSGPAAAASASATSHQPQPESVAKAPKEHPAAPPGEATSSPPAPIAPPAEPAAAAEPPAPAEPAAAAALAPAPAPAPAPEPAAEPPADPEDWSSELLHLDRELQRLQWGRAEEEVYLQRAFGHPSRNRLTSYADLLAYLRAIEALGSPADPADAAVPMRRQDLLSQCDALLRQLGWPRERARQFLESQLQVSSRQQLSDQDLLQFNLLLEGELLAAGA